MRVAAGLNRDALLPRWCWGNDDGHRQGNGRAPRLREEGERADVHGRQIGGVDVEPTHLVLLALRVEEERDAVTPGAAGALPRL